MKYILKKEYISTKYLKTSIKKILEIRRKRETAWKQILSMV